MSRQTKATPIVAHDTPQFYNSGYPYRVHTGYQNSSSQRPSSAGISRSRASSSKTPVGTTNVYVLNNALNNVALSGSGYNIQQQAQQSNNVHTHTRPGSANPVSRQSHTISSQPNLGFGGPGNQIHNHHSHGHQIPTSSATTSSSNTATATVTATVITAPPSISINNNNNNTNSSSQPQQYHHHHISRPKSASSGIRKADTPSNLPSNHNILNSYNDNTPNNTNRIPSTNPTKSLDNTQQIYIHAPPISQPQQSNPNGAASASAKLTQVGADHWNTSYKLHYGFSTNPTGTLPPSNPSSSTVSAPNATTATVSPSVNINTNARPSSSSSSATKRIQQAINDSMKYNALEEGEYDDRDMDIAMLGEELLGNELDMGLDAPDVLNGRRILLRGDDDEEEMDGKPVTLSRSHPEVSTATSATPSQSTELANANANIVYIDGRNSTSIDSFVDEDINIGLPTVPNQFCTKRDAIALRQLILMSNTHIGGIAPSSSAVMDMYMVGKVIGVGSYGKVRAAWHRLTTSKVAIKTYDKAKLKDPAHWKRVYSEIKIMEQVSHPRIARMYEAIETPKRMHLIMECLDGGNLCSYVKSKRRLTEEESRRIFYQILQSVEYLHSLGVTHRDIKLENVLFTDNRDIKLIDFGFSTVCQQGKRLKVFCGTPSYMAPEIVRRTEYEGKPVDMWSLGILLYALLCGCFPFRAKSYPDLYRRIARGAFIIPEELSAPVKDILRQLLCVDASQRLTSQTAMRHTWLQSQIGITPDMSKLRREMPILISDRPADDIDDETLNSIQVYGISKDEVIRAVLTKVHSSITTLYYLLREINITKRKAAGNTNKKPTLLHSIGASSSNSNYPSSSSSSSGYAKPRDLSGTGTAIGATAAGDPSSSGLRPIGGTEAIAMHYIQRQQYQASSNANSNSSTGATTTAGTSAAGSAQLQRPKSASGTNISGSNRQRPLSAYAGRR